MARMPSKPPPGPVIRSGRPGGLAVQPARRRGASPDRIDQQRQPPGAARLSYHPAQSRPNTHQAQHRGSQRAGETRASAPGWLPVCRFQVPVMVVRLTPSTAAIWATGRARRPSGHTAGGRLFRSENGNPIQPSTYWRVWQKTRGLALTPGQLATPLMRRPYDLRHSGVTWRLNSGVPATEVAAWAGHSVEVLMRVYARCVADLEDVWTARMDASLRRPASRRAGRTRTRTRRERSEMIRMTGEAGKGCRQIHATSTAQATWAQRRGNGQGTSRPGAIRARNLVDSGPRWRRVAEPGIRLRSHSP